MALSSLSQQPVRRDRGADLRSDWAVMAGNQTEPHRSI